MRLRVLSLWAFGILSGFSCSKNKSTAPTITPLAECTSDGQVDCLTTEAFPAIIKADLLAKAAEIRSSVTLGGVAGTMLSCAGDNQVDCLSSAEFPSVIKSDLSAARIQNGKVVAGITGSYGSPCSADGQTDCLTGSAFKAGDTGLISAFDLRSGKTIAGYVSKLAFNRNATDISTFNRTAGAGANASLTEADAYDSIDDYNNNGAFPTARPAGSPALSGNWQRDPASDSDGNSLCNGSEDCVYRDLNSNRYWARVTTETNDWELQISSCESSTFGSYDDWRLPTQKELMQAYIDGIYSIKTDLNIISTTYQSATSLGLLSTSRYVMNLAVGEVTADVKASAQRRICVR